ncbi:MAG TPA: ATP-binding protein [Tepidisphaeraceae bacterium]|jgi:signal transduction histidine kinase
MGADGSQRKPLQAQVQMQTETVVQTQSQTPPGAPAGPRRAPSRLLLRGESVIGPIGIAIAAVLVAVVAFAGWWSLRSDQEAWRNVRAEQVRVLGSVLSQSAESMLAENDLSPLRRLLVDAKQNHRLAECRIILPDGRILADADPTKITLVAAPAKWPSGPVDDLGDNPSAQPSSSDRISIRQPLLIRGRGSAMLIVSADITTQWAHLWEIITGIGLIGAAGLAAMLILYRVMRARVITLGLIRESLLASQGGTSCLDTLCLRADLGPEAAAWNRLLEENELLRKAGVAERVKGSLGQRKEGRSDLEHACDALAVGMIIVDEQSRVKHANGAAAVLLQQPKRDQMIGQPVSSLIDDPAVAEAISAIGSGSGQRRTIEIRRSGDQGGGVLRVHIRPLRREDAGGALITIEDVTQQRVADAARNSFVAQATHELRTPLTNMRLALENALEEKDADSKALLEHFNVLNHETRRLERMVGEMLSVAEIEAGSLTLKRDDVRMEKVFEELAADYKQQAADKKVSLAFDLPPKFPVMQADRDKLMVTLHNLMGNAMKYTPAGGKITIAVRSDTSQVVVDVIDTGIGIGADEQPRIFEKFYRAKDKRVEQITGTGLGLTLAREIARLHGGDITVQSELNKGSTFTLTLPAHAHLPAKAA